MVVKTWIYMQNQDRVSGIKKLGLDKLLIF